MLQNATMKTISIYLNPLFSVQVVEAKCPGGELRHRSLLSLQLLPQSQDTSRPERILDTSGELWTSTENICRKAPKDILVTCQTISAHFFQCRETPLSSPQMKTSLPHLWGWAWPPQRGSSFQLLGPGIIFFWSWSMSRKSWTICTGATPSLLWTRK